MLIWLSLRGATGGAIMGFNLLLISSPLSFLWFKRGLIHLLKTSAILSPLISLEENIWDGKDRGTGEDEEKDDI